MPPRKHAESLSLRLDAPGEPKAPESNRLRSVKDAPLSCNPLGEFLARHHFPEQANRQCALGAASVSARIFAAWAEALVECSVWAWHSGTPAAASTSATSHGAGADDGDNRLLRKGCVTHGITLR